MGLEQAALTPNSNNSLALTFLNDVEAKIVEAIAERIIPDDGDGAGATEAGVVYYIDRALSGFSTDLQQVYRTGLTLLEQHCQDHFSAAFPSLSIDQQDGVVRQFLGAEVVDREAAPRSGGETEPGLPELRRLFAVVREHTIEGFFCDPAYGGNRAAVGWKMVGFPGAYSGYTAEQMAAGFDGRSLPIVTLSDLRARLTTLPDNTTS